MTSDTGVSIKARSMARLSFVTLDPAGLSGVARQARHQLAEERALLEILSEAGVRRGNPIQRQHLLHGVGIAEQHHNFFDVRATHGLTPSNRCAAGTHASPASLNSKGHARPTAGPWLCVND
jgi:hypothetical protein